MLRVAPQVFECRTRSVRSSPEIDARCAELHAHRVEVVHRNPGGVLPRVGAQFTQAASQSFELVRRIECGRQRGLVIRAVERARLSRATLVDEHDVAAGIQFREDRHRDADHAGRRLARPTGEHEHRVRLLVARHGGHDREVNVDLSAARRVWIFGHRYRAAQDFAFDPGKATRLESVGARARAGPACRQRQ